MKTAYRFRDNTVLVCQWDGEIRIDEWKEDGDRIPEEYVIFRRPSEGGAPFPIDLRTGTIGGTGPKAGQKFEGDLEEARREKQAEWNKKGKGKINFTGKGEYKKAVKEKSTKEKTPKVVSRGGHSNGHESGEVIGTSDGKFTVNIENNNKEKTTKTFDNEKDANNYMNKEMERLANERRNSKKETPQEKPIEPQGKETENETPKGEKVANFKRTENTKRGGRDTISRESIEKTLEKMRQARGENPKTTEKPITEKEVEKSTLKEKPAEKSIEKSEKQVETKPSLPVKQEVKLFSDKDSEKFKTMLAKESADFRDKQDDAESLKDEEIKKAYDKYHSSYDKELDKYKSTLDKINQAEDRDMDNAHKQMIKSIDNGIPKEKAETIYQGAVGLIKSRYDRQRKMAEEHLDKVDKSLKEVLSAEEKRAETKCTRTLREAQKRFELAKEKKRPEYEATEREERIKAQNEKEGRTEAERLVKQGKLAEENIEKYAKAYSKNKFLTQQLNGVLKVEKGTTKTALNQKKAQLSNEMSTMLKRGSKFEESAEKNKIEREQLAQQKEELFNKAKQGNKEALIELHKKGGYVEIPNNNKETSKLTKNEGKYFVDGKEITLKEAKEYLQNSKLFGNLDLGWEKPNQDITNDIKFMLDNPKPMVKENAKDQETAIEKYQKELEEWQEKTKATRERLSKYVFRTPDGKEGQFGGTLRLGGRDITANDILNANFIDTKKHRSIEYKDGSRRIEQGDIDKLLAQNNVSVDVFKDSSDRYTPKPNGEWEYINRAVPSIRETISAEEMLKRVSGSKES